jgi:hypothetical protein
LGYTRAANTVKTELSMSKGRFKLAKDTINVMKSIGKKVTEDAFTWFLMMAPNKHKLAIEVNFTGSQILSNKIPNRILEILADQNTIKLIADNVSHKLQQLRISHPGPLCKSWVDVGNAQIIAAPAWEQKVPPRDLFTMARTVKYKHVFPTKELNKIHSEEAFTLGDFELFSPRMKAFMEYCLVIPYALMYKVVIRSMELAGLDAGVDANQPLQWFCDLLKERKDFVKSNPAHCRPFPAEFLITDSWTDEENKSHVHIPYIFSHHKRIDLINPMPGSNLTKIQKTVL